MKVCRYCMDRLDVGVNWYVSSHRKNDFECKGCRNHKRRGENRPYTLADRNTWLKRKYNITSTEYDSMLISQGGTCFICKGNELSKKGFLNVDHSHTTGRVRGLLCTPCNVGLGLFKDNIETMKKALAYLEREEQ